MQENANSLRTATGRAAALLMVCTSAVWARPVICRVELDKEVLRAGEDQTAVIKVSLETTAPKAGERAPVNLAVVLDRSGSMRGDKLEKAKEAAITALRRLRSGDLFSLVTYDHRVKTIVPAQDAGNSASIERQIRKIRAGETTALFGGVSQGAAEIRKNLHDERYVHRVILLSDGLANVGPDSPEDLGRLGAALIKESISVTTVGVGTDYNEDLMTQLSQKSDGNTYFVESSRDLPRIFAAELGDVLSVVARKVIIEIECPEGTRPIRIIGRDGRIKGNKAEIYLNQLYGGQQKYALVELKVPASAADATREIAIAKCTYENAVTLATERTLAKASARFSADDAEVILNANQDVQFDVSANVFAALKDKAVELMDTGQTAAAVELMRSNSLQMREAGVRFGNDGVIRQGEELEVEAQRLQEQGMDKVMRKNYRTDSFQERNQQTRE